MSCTNFSDNLILLTEVMARKSDSIDVKKKTIAFRDIGISQHEISRRLKISCRCIRQTLREFDKVHTIVTKPGAGRPPKVTDREKRLIKLQQFRDNTSSLADLVRFINTNLNLSIGRPTISRIFQDYNMVSYMTPRQPRITPTQRQNRLTWCYDHLYWSINDWSNVIFSGFSPMKATLNFLIERIESTFVTLEMIELDLNDDKSELTKVVTLSVSHISIYLSNIDTIQTDVF